MILGTHHTAFPMEENSRVGEARRHAARLGDLCALDEVAAGRLALVVTELGTNLVRHAQGGQLLVAARPLRREVEVIAIDHGPGIADVERSLGDGYTTGTTPGTGLGAVRRLSQHFDIHSAVPAGTVVVARVQAQGAAAAVQPSIYAGAISLCAPGEDVCGDSWAFALEGDVAAVMVADGLGHGPAAAEASGTAQQVFAAEPMNAPRRLLEDVHARLRSTRGAAVMLLQADAVAGTVRSAGAGNVMARLVSGTSDRALLCQHGTAGMSIRTPEEVSTPWPPHAMLVVWSDGVESRWNADLLRPLLGRDPTLAAAVLVRHHCRGRDDVTVAVLRRKD
ncbi:MAG: signal transduction protein fusion protein : serine/threonine protein kinase [Ramlibacter sp.]|nr:signal transduction protein fusion protein : serine/threonine protein kinase [Ramlibacter sp.]